MHAGTLYSVITKDKKWKSLEKNNDSSIYLYKNKYYRGREYGGHVSWLKLFWIHLGPNKMN